MHTTGRAVLVAYRIYRGPGNRYGKIPGVLGRGEFGQEIAVAVALLVAAVGLSFDKVCLLLGFFQNRDLSKSQADARLSRLARHREGEFERLGALRANSRVVHADETGWSTRSVRAFLSEKARLLAFGVYRRLVNEIVRLALDCAIPGQSIIPMLICGSVCPTAAVPH